MPHLASRSLGLRLGRRGLAATFLAGVLLCAHARAEPAPDQTQRLAALCEVWGLLKYQHPGVAERADWDEVLLSAVPSFEAAATRQALNREVVSLVAEAGLDSVFRDSPTIVPRDAASLGDAFRWIDDTALFEPETSLLLKAVVLAHRPGPNRYVTKFAGAGNPDFSGDQRYYASNLYPDEPLRLLALCRYWNMVQYFFPCRDVMDRDWVVVLAELIPKFQAAPDAIAYHLAVAEMTASINDAHASTASSVLTTYFGSNTAPVQVSLVEGRTVVTRVYPRLLESGIDLRVGDVLTHIGGVPVTARRASLRKIVNGSNEASLERNIHRLLLRTNEPRLALTLETASGWSMTIDVNTVTLGTLSAEQSAEGGAVASILPGNVGYVHMGRLKVADVAGVMAQLRATSGIVFDIRNYPQDTLYAVSNYLNPSARPFTKFLKPTLDSPGRFDWTSSYLAGPGSPNAWPGAPAASYTYVGTVAILVNEETQSQAEFTVMALKTAPDATVLGSQTAGADGNVSSLQLPGGVSTRFSGLGVFYPDGTPTQRVGIVPNRVVTPTIRGLREGRDEVLEAALELLR